MNREKVDPFKYVREVNKLLRGDGLFLVSGSFRNIQSDLKANAMTIGWGFLGTMWRRPVFVVAVRHSRYSFKLMEEEKDWTVCLPGKGMEVALEFCGTKSGRDYDKFKEMNLTPKKGIEIEAPYIEECPIHYECTTIFKTDLKPGQLHVDIEKEVYPSKDLHMIYFGEVKGAYVVKDVD